MAWGIKVATPATNPAVNGSVKLSQIYLVASIVNIAADIDGVRFVGSSFLRLFRRPVRTVEITGPLAFADVALLEPFALEHALGPTPDGEGWGVATWQRRQLIPIAKTYNVLEGTVSLRCIDPRDFYTNWWSTFLTDIGHSLDGQGIPLLHLGGGGLQVSRAQVAFVERPGSPPDGLIMDVPADLPAYDYRGLVVEGGGAVNSMLNSTFSLGAGNAFTYWTPVVGGTGTVTESKTVYQFDVDGLRRSCRVFCGAADSAVAYIQSDAVAVTGPFRVRVRTYNNFGPGKLAAVIRRVSDGFHWDDTAKAFVSALTLNRCGNDFGRYADWHSNLISPGGAASIAVFVGYFAETGTINFEAYVTSVELVDGAPTHVGSDLPTTTTPVTRVATEVTIRNDEIGRVWSPARGSLTLGFTPFWNAKDLAVGTVKIIWSAENGGGAWARIAFIKGEGAGLDRYVFERTLVYASFFVSGATIPTRGVKVKLAVRWTGTDGELGLHLTHQIFVNDVKGVDGAVAAIPAIEPAAYISVGNIGGFGYHMDGTLSHVDLSPLVLADEELARRPA